MNHKRITGRVRAPVARTHGKSVVHVCDKVLHANSTKDITQLVNSFVHIDTLTLADDHILLQHSIALCVWEGEGRGGEEGEGHSYLILYWFLITFSSSLMCTGLQSNRYMPILLLLSKSVSNIDSFTHSTHYSYSGSHTAHTHTHDTWCMNAHSDHTC